MAFKGTLDTLSMIEVLQVICMTRKTGCLAVKHPTGDAKELYFEAGEIIAATSNSAKDRLGATLVKMGVLSQDQVDASRKAAQVTGIKQGQTLVSRGLLTEEQLNTALVRQIAEIFFSVIVWHEGSFEFLDEEQPGPDVFCVRESVTNLVLQATQQLDEWRVIEKVLTSMDLVVTMAPARDSSSPISLQPDEWQLLTLIDGKRSIRDVSALSTHTNFDVCKKLYHLHRAGLITTSQGRNVTRPPPARRVPDSFYAAVRAEFMRHVGPMADILIDEVAEAVGAPLDKLPVNRVAQVAKLLCAEIDSPEKSEHFHEFVMDAGRG